MGVTFDLQLFGAHPSEVSPSVRFCISTQIRKNVLIMHYDFIFGFYDYFRGAGGRFIVNQFTYFCTR